MRLLLGRPSPSTGGRRCRHPSRRGSPRARRAAPVCGLGIHRLYQPTGRTPVTDERLERDLLLLLLARTASTAPPSGSRGEQISWSASTRPRRHRVELERRARTAAGIGAPTRWKIARRMRYAGAAAVHVHRSPVPRVAVGGVEGRGTSPRSLVDAVLRTPRIAPSPLRCSARDVQRDRRPLGHVALREGARLADEVTRRMLHVHAAPPRLRSSSMTSSVQRTSPY